MLVTAFSIIPPGRWIFQKASKSQVATSNPRIPSDSTDNKWGYSKPQVYQHIVLIPPKGPIGIKLHLMWVAWNLTNSSVIFWADQVPKAYLMSHWGTPNLIWIEMLETSVLPFSSKGICLVQMNSAGQYSAVFSILHPRAFFCLESAEIGQYKIVFVLKASHLQLYSTQVAGSTLRKHFRMHHIPKALIPFEIKHGLGSTDVGNPHFIEKLCAGIIEVKKCSWVLCLDSG